MLDQVEPQRTTRIDSASRAAGFPTPSTSPNSNWPEVARTIDAIPGTNCREDERDFLYYLSLQTTGTGEIVEIGTNVGKSTIALSFAQKEKGGRPIHTIDIYEHPRITAHLAQAGVSDYVRRTVESSPLAAARWNQPIELLFIDGDHSYVGVSMDIKKWSPFVVPGGRIALHDYPGFGKQFHWVSKAINKYLLSKPAEWKVVSDREAGSIFVVERLPQRQKQFTWTQRLRNFFYWRLRDARSYAFSYCPRLSKALVGKVMARIKRKAGS